MDKESVYYNTFATYADVYNEEDGEPQCDAGTDKIKVDGKETGNESSLEGLYLTKSISATTANGHDDEQQSSSDDDTSSTKSQPLDELCNQLENENEPTEALSLIHI